MTTCNGRREGHAWTYSTFQEASVTIRQPGDRVLFGAEEGKRLMVDEPTMYPPSVRSSVLNALWILLLVVVIAMAVVIALVWRAV
jgi:hypothetical protein